MPETDGPQQDITAKVEEESPGSRRLVVDFQVAGSACPEVPGEAHVIIERVGDGDLHVVRYDPPASEAPGESSTDWQTLAVEAVEEHLATIGSGGAA